MATTEEERLRKQLSAEREQLADAVDTLRSELGEATDLAGKLQSKLPVVAAGALGLGFLVAGGVGATARLLFRRGRETAPTAKAGRFSLVFRRR
jgi:hypothetical protein